MSSKHSFEGEAKKAFDAVRGLLESRRTVGIGTIAAACERENDPRWMSRIQNLLPEFIQALRGRGFQVFAVNARCVKRHSEVPVTDPLEALKCVQLRAGGAAPAGIRKARPDDRVFQAHLQSLADLGGSGINAVIFNAKEAEALGIIPADATTALAAGVRNRIDHAAALPAPPIQAALPE